MPGHGANAIPKALSGRQPDQATAAQHRDHRTHSTHAPCGRSASARPPPTRARREEYYLCPPIHPQALPGIRVGACNRFCCAVASTTSTEPPANCSTVTPPSTSPAASCRSRARTAERPSVRPVPRSTGQTHTSSFALGLAAARASPPLLPSIPACSLRSPPVVRPGPCPPREGRTASALSAPPTRWNLPARQAAVLP